MSNMITVGKLRYDPNQVLGRGGFGTVFSGFHIVLGKSLFRSAKSTPVAVKRVEKSIVNEPIVRWEEELMKKASNHPNILKYIHSEMNTEFLFIATELCSGTLDDYIIGNKYQGPRFSSETEILRQVTRGLSHLHNSLKIVHRDIKPTNIFIFVSSSEGAESKPQIKLADFDISKLLKTDQSDFTNTSPTNPSGSWGWMAPEVYESNRFDFKVDVWALGLIFAYTLTGGKHPYGDDPGSRTYRIKQKDFMVLKRGDLMEVYRNGGAFELIESMLKVEAKDRPTVIDVLKDSFLKDEVRTTQFLELCNSFQDSITNDKIVQFKELVKDETVDVNAKAVTQDEIEISPLHLLCCYYENDNLIELVQYLLLNGADVHSKTKCIDEIAVIGLTPLHLLLVFNKNRKVIDIGQLLIENGADVNAKNDCGFTPLHGVCSTYGRDNLKGIVQFLLKNGAEVNAKNEDGFTPFHCLCSNADYQNDNLKDVAQFLIENGAHANAKDENGMTPLNCLCESYRDKNEMNEKDKRDLTSLVLFLVENGADIYAKDDDGETPADRLAYAIEMLI